LLAFDRMRLRPRPSPPRDRARIDADLERLGVGAPLRDALAGRLEALAPTLSEDAYQAALAGVAAAYDVHRLGEEGRERSARDYQEIQRLLSVFSGEMKKLDEALRVLSNYVRRMRSQPQAREPKATVH
jgi:hypothetical protein